MAICAPGDARLLGKIALDARPRLPATTCAAIRASDHPAGELSCWVLRDARGRGVASAAVAAILHRARRLEALRSVVLDIEADNVASLRVAERLGAQRRQPNGLGSIVKVSPAP